MRKQNCYCLFSIHCSSPLVRNFSCRSTRRTDSETDWRLQPISPESGCCDHDQHDAIAPSRDAVIFVSWACNVRQSLVYFAFIFGILETDFWTWRHSVSGLIALVLFACLAPLASALALLCLYCNFVFCLLKHALTWHLFDALCITFRCVALTTALMSFNSARFLLSQIALASRYTRVVLCSNLYGFPMLINTCVSLLFPSAFFSTFYYCKLLYLLVL